MTEIILKTRNTLRSRNKRKLELLGIGIKEIQTIIVSKIFHPLLKNCDFLGSPIKRIVISITKTFQKYCDFLLSYKLNLITSD